MQDNCLIRIIQIIATIIMLLWIYEHYARHSVAPINSTEPAMSEPSEPRDAATGRRLFKNTNETTQTTNLDSYNQND